MCLQRAKIEKRSSNSEMQIQKRPLRKSRRSKGDQVQNFCAYHTLRSLAPLRMTPGLLRDMSMQKTDGSGAQKRCCEFRFSSFASRDSLDGQPAVYFVGDRFDERQVGPQGGFNVDGIFFSLSFTEVQ